MAGLRLKAWAEGSCSLVSLWPLTPLVPLVPVIVSVLESQVCDSGYPRGALEILEEIQENYHCYDSRTVMYDDDFEAVYTSRELV